MADQMKMRLDLRLTQRLIMTPQLQQAIRLLQLSRLELNQVMTQEMVENPLLEDTNLESDEESNPEAESENERKEAASEEKEEGGSELEGIGLQWDEYLDDDGYEGREESRASSASDDLPSYEQTLAKAETLQDHLLWQLNLTNATEEQKKVATAVIGNLDEDGYLRLPLQELADSLGVPLEAAEEAVKRVQTFDPTGVGARDLQECLLIQIQQLGLGESPVEAIVRQHLVELEKKRYPAIAKALGVSVEEVCHAAKVIEHLEPKPGRPFTRTDNLYIIPDVFVVKSEGKYHVVLNDDGLPRLRINPYYRKLLRSRGEQNDPTRAYLEGKFRSALWLIRSIEQRNRTIVRVAESIVKFQQEFFEKGLAHLKPLVLKQVAEDISMHESTISRVTTNKYIHTPQGVFELKFFFNSSVPRAGGEGESLSSITVREMIRKMVGEESPARPLTDQEIVERLKAHQIGIARRTVAKYRAWLNIPPASKRKRSF